MLSEESPMVMGNHYIARAAREEDGKTLSMD